MVSRYIWTLGEPIDMSEEFELYHKSEARDEQPPYHAHEFYEVFFLVAGTMSMAVEEYEYKLAPCDIMILPPGYMHRGVYPDLTLYNERMLLYLHPDFLKEIGYGSFLPADILAELTQRRELHHSFCKERFTVLCNQMDAVLADIRNGNDGTYVINRSRVVALVAQLCEALSHAAAEQINTTSQLMYGVISYINAHLREELSLEMLADRFFISKYHLLHEFKEHTNISVHQYILYKRIVMARQLMSGGASPSEACAGSGFRDYTSFFRCFKKVTGLSPREYAAKMRRV